MYIEKYIEKRGRNNPYYHSALKLAYDYHKDIPKDRLLILQDKAQEAHRLSHGTWETLAICMVIYKLLK